jgi:hypothetical protein
MWDAAARFRLPAASLLAAVAFWPGLLAGSSSPRWWAVALLAPLASDPRSLPGPVLALWAAALGWAAAGLAWSPDPAAGLVEWYFLALVFLTMTAAAAAENLDASIRAFGWGIAATAGLAWLQAAGWHPVPGTAGTFGNPELLAEAAAPVAVWAAIRGASRGGGLLARTGDAALAGVLAACLASSGSRIGALVALAALLWAWRRVFNLAWPAAVCGLLAAGLALLLLAGPVKLESASIRLGLWLDAAGAITPAGHGLGWWAWAHPLDWRHQFAHSDALQAMAELGWGALPLLAIAAILATRGAADAATRWAALAAALEACVSFPLHMPATALLAGLLAGGLARRGPGVRVAERAGGAGDRGAARRDAPRPGGVAPADRPRVGLAGADPASRYAGDRGGRP